MKLSPRKSKNYDFYATRFTTNRQPISTTSSPTNQPDSTKIKLFSGRALARTVIAKIYPLSYGFGVLASHLGRSENVFNRKKLKIVTTIPRFLLNQNIFSSSHAGRNNTKTIGQWV
ncbi:MAG: hypothetical protein HWD59_01875 [Coxiellaceae bacterium]|nr:MAG: hypothetical protein HWD59_01875 [Coxiellaceae bacterium]